jgi:hypothetical protein
MTHDGNKRCATEGGRCPEEASWRSENLPNADLWNMCRCRARARTRSRFRSFSLSCLTFSIEGYTLSYNPGYHIPCFRGEAEEDDCKDVVAWTKTPSVARGMKFFNRLRLTCGAQRHGGVEEANIANRCRGLPCPPLPL